ncbi:unnamed protein product, partial [Closterium sp. NIES-53]
HRAWGSWLEDGLELFLLVTLTPPGSSCEAEIYAGAMAAQELRWLTYLLTDLGEAPRSPPVLYVDNKALLALCQEHRLEHRTKHIALRYFLARELQQRGQLRLAYVASQANAADVFTKALQPCDHQRFCTVSSCEAEIYAGAMAAQELRWLTYLLTDLGEAPRSPPVLYVDNKALLALCQEHRLEHRTKHIALRYFLARELQQRGQLRLAYVASQANTADVFTKALQPSLALLFLTEAIMGPYSSLWQTAMDAEMASWKSTGTYIDEVPPPGANIVDGMWIFRVKRPPGSALAFKARYVARGFSERQGVDYFQTFSHTPKMTTLWVLLHVVAQRDYELHSLDFSTAFLQGSLHEEIWLRRQPGFTESFPVGTQWSLRRPVYGLRQVPREWHDIQRTTLAAVGYAPATADPSLVLRTDTSLKPFYILVYIDDLVFATADTQALTLVKLELQKRHTCTDLGELRSYLGLQITRDRAQRTITLTHSHMVHQVLQRFGFQFSSPQPTSVSTSHSLSTPPSFESVELSCPYPELVGCLMYLMTCTRPDLAYPLSLLARFVAPGMHRKARVWRTGSSCPQWSHRRFVAMQRSSQGYTFSLGSGSVSWWPTRSSSVLSSSCEAEIYAGAMAAQELRWLTYLLADLGEQPRLPPVLYVDNKVMIALCREHRLEHRTKHIALRYFLARELQQRGQLCLAYMATRANTADIFTKALLPACFAFLDWSCDHLFSPTLPMGRPLRQIDVGSAFLHAPVDADIFVEQQHAFQDADGVVCLLQKFLYGIKQTPRLWQQYLHTVLMELGFTQLPHDLGMYRKESRGKFILRVAYVDDLLYTGDNTELLDRFEADIKKLEVTINHNVTQFLGLNITQSATSIHLSTAKYVETLVKKFAVAPINLTTPFRTPSPNHEPDTTPLFIEDHRLYQQQLGWENLLDLRRALQYFISTPDVGLTYEANLTATLQLHGYVDADHAGDIGNRRSCTGFIFQLQPAGLISWNSQKQELIALSSAEAEFIAASAAIREGLYLMELLQEAKVMMNGHFTLLCDNQSAIKIANKPSFVNRTKHIALRYFFVKDEIDKGEVKLTYCPTGDMAADFLTKKLPRQKFQHCTDLCGVYLLSDSRDSVSLFDHTSGAAPAPPAIADSATRSQWLTRDAAARLAIRNHLPLAECAHFGQHRTAQTLYDAVVARYSSPATAALGRLLLPYLFPELSTFATVEDLVSHLRASNARYCAALLAEFLDKNPPPIYITLYFIVTRLPDSPRSVRDHFHSLDPTSLTVDLLEQHLLAAETSAVADVGAASASEKRRSSKGKGGTGGGGGSGSGGGGSSGGSGGSGSGGSGGSGGGSGGVGGGGGGSNGSGGSGSGESGGGRTGAQRGGSRGGQWQWQQRRSETPSPEQLCEWLFQRGASGGSVSCPYVIRTGDRPRQTCGKAHKQHRCFSRLDDAWRAEFGDEVERPHWAELLRSGVAIFDLDYDAILSAMYALSASGEGECYRCVPPDPSIEDAALGAGESSLTGLCLAVPSGSLSGLHLPSFSTNLVSTAALQDAMVTTSTPGGQRVSICTCTRTGRHLATFTRQPGSSLYTLASKPPQVAASAQVSTSGQVAPPCSCRLLSHQTLLWHHRLVHPTLPRLHGMNSCLLVSGLPRTLPPLPPSPAPPCLPCVEGRQRAAPHSSFPPTTAPLQTLYIDVWGPARGQVVDVLIPWIRAVRLQLREQFRADLPVLRVHSDRGGEFSSDLLRDFCHLAYSALDRGGWRCVGVPGLRFSYLCSRFVHGQALRPRYSLRLPWLSPNARGRQFYHPTSHHVFPSEDVMFDESVPFYHPLLSIAPVEVAVGSGATRGAASGGAEPGIAEFEGAGSVGAEPGGVEPGGADSEGAESGGAESRGATSSRGHAGASPRLSPQQLRQWLVWRARLWSGATGAGAVGAGGAGVTAVAGGTRGTAVAGPGGAPTKGTGAARTGGVGGTKAGDPTEPGAAGAGGSSVGGVGARGAGASGTGTGGAGAGGAGVGGTGVGGVGAGGTDSGGAGAGGAGVRGTGTGGAGAGGAGAVDPGGTVRP